MSKIHIGISGWTFDGWRENFYPAGLRTKDELSFASRKVTSIEVNGTFHSLFRPANFQSWYEQTPADFVFALKGPKYITHERRLKDFETPLSNFLASGILALGEKLGPILWQFPPNLPFTEERFGPFMAALPKDMATAARLGTGHSTWLEGRTYLTPTENLPMRHAIEGRHPSFKSPEFISLARRHGIAVVFGDTAGRWPYMEDVTSDFIYLRMHGDETKYPDGYTKAALERWGDRFQTWASGAQPIDADVVSNYVPPTMLRPLFAYFDNDVKELAPLNASSLIAHLTQLGVLTTRLNLGALPTVGTKKKTAASSADAARNAVEKSKKVDKTAKAKPAKAKSAKAKPTKASREAAAKGEVIARPAPAKRRRRPTATERSPATSHGRRA